VALAWNANAVAASARRQLSPTPALIILPARHELSAHHELINGIDVVPDYLPLTA
jgi:hypothetical protein